MTVTLPSVHRQPPPATTNSRDDLRTLAGATVLVLGLFMDGWAHTNVVEELESFVTPYHLVIFLGFALTAGWIGRLVRDRRDGTADFAAAVPGGYLPAVVGIALFAAGFLGDGLWHTMFGIEAGIDALLSPTHLIMFAGLLAVFTAPWRAARARRARRDTESDRPVWTGRWPAVLSVLLVTLTVSFFLLYAWVPSFGIATTGGTDWLLSQADGMAMLELSQSGWLTSSFVVTAVLVAPVVLVAREYVAPPRGVATFLLVLVGVAMAGMRELEMAELLPAFLLAGLATDLALARARHDRRLLAVGIVLPAVLWSCWWAGLAVWHSIGWVPALWTGQVVFATLVGGGVALALTPSAPLPSPVDDTPA